MWLTNLKVRKQRSRRSEREQCSGALHFLQRDFWTTSPASPGVQHYMVALY
jgi:hypothetical protein